MEYVPYGNLVLLLTVLAVTLVLIFRKQREQPENLGLPPTSFIPVNAAVGQTVTVEFKQPANSRLTNISVTAITAGTYVSGSIGTQVGFTSSTGEVSAAAATNLLSTGTTLVVNKSVNLTLLNTVALAERTLYLQVIATTATTAAGAVRFAVSFIKYE